MTDRLDDEAALAEARRDIAEREMGRPPAPVASSSDPWTSKVAADRVEPTRGSRKANVLAALRAAGGGWVSGVDLCAANVGGSEGLRRCRELRAAGFPIERQPSRTSRTGWEYRLIEEDR